MPVRPVRAPAIVAYVALGSNLGDRDANLAFAVSSLDAAPGVDRLAVSSVFETDPVGPPGQRAYLNAVVSLSTRLAPRPLLERLLAIERAAGRERGEHWGPRVLDLDLLLHGSYEVDEPGLVIPHPRLHERAFVLEPFADLAPEALHPKLGLSIAELAAKVRDPAAVRPWPTSIP